MAKTETKQRIWNGRFPKLAVAGMAVFAAMQAIRPEIPTKSATAEIQAPARVKQILKKSCYSCHSDERRLAWFDEIVPAYWLVRHDILAARERMNFSTLGSKPQAVQMATLYEAVNMIQLGAMPLSSFAKLHPEARITPEEIETIKAYLRPWANAPKGAEASQSSTFAPTRAGLSSIAPDLNGVPLDPDFENWKVISTTDRGDNNTFRFILGNDAAVRAVQSGHITPWPNGARLAKIAWQQEIGSDGLIYPGSFYQVELMRKDASKYRSTDGWGWGRWRGLDLHPYGADAGFVKECTGCHMPLRGNDYVYTFPITPAHNLGDALVNRHAASLPADLPWQPLQWNAITMFVDPGSHTTATLYGNDAAIAAVRHRGDRIAHPGYPPGAVLALVTWRQREDPHWFGARIPDQPECVEFVEIKNTTQYSRYRRLPDAALAEDHPSEQIAARRTEFITHLRPVRLPARLDDPQNAEESLRRGVVSR